MEEPTCEQLFDEDGFELVAKASDTSWRHGSYDTAVYKRESDNTFWATSYRVSTDGETHELREGEADICQVFPKTKEVTVYTKEP